MNESYDLRRTARNILQEEDAEEMVYALLRDRRELQKERDICGETLQKLANESDLYSSGKMAGRLQDVEAERDRLKHAYSVTADEVTQVLGEALGYPRFVDDPENFPDATEEDGVVIGDHVPETLAAEAADRLKEAEARVERYRDLLERVVRDYDDIEGEDLTLLDMSIEDIREEIRKDLGLESTADDQE